MWSTESRSRCTNVEQTNSSGGRKTKRNTYGEHQRECVTRGVMSRHLTRTNIFKSFRCGRVSNFKCGSVNFLLRTSQWVSNIRVLTAGPLGGEKSIILFLPVRENGHQQRDYNDGQHIILCLYGLRLAHGTAVIIIRYKTSYLVCGTDTGWTIFVVRKNRNALTSRIKI